MERPQEDHELMAAHGEAVRRIMAEPVVKELFVELQQRYFRMWQSSEDVAARERIHAQARALSDLETAFQAVMDAGTIANQHLERDRH